MSQLTIQGKTSQTFANIAASATATSVISAVSGKVLRIHAVAMVTGATATNATFNSATTAISCLFANGANGGAVLPFLERGWFETTSGAALTVTTGAGATTGFQIIYSEV